jgi:hypothetical protein
MRLRGSNKLKSVILVAVAGLLMVPLTALASHVQKGVDANLRPVPHSEKADGGSQVRGDVDIEVKGGKVEVEVKAWGLAPKLVHAQHIHGIAADECPGPKTRDDLKDDGLISTLEGAPAYGGIVVSLTTRGDASPDSGLAVDRFPVADKRGRIDYERTFWVGKNFRRPMGGSRSQPQRDLDTCRALVGGVHAGSLWPPLSGRRVRGSRPACGPACFSPRAPHARQIRLTGLLAKEAWPLSCFFSGGPNGI